MKRILALMLAAALLPALAACNKSTPANETPETGVTTSAPEETSGADESTLPEETTMQEETSGADESTLPEETTAPDEETSKASETAKAKLPQTREEIVAYYNEAVNRVKTEKPGFTWTQQTFVSNIASSSAVINWLAPQAMNFVPLEVLEMEPAAKGADHNEQFNVRLKPWSSRLAPSMVSNATFVDKGTTYELRIDLKPEKRAALPNTESDHDHGKVFTVMTYSTIHDIIDPYAWLATMETFAPSYRDSWVKLTIDKETDRPVKAEYMLTYDLVAGVKPALLPVIEATATISMHEIYTIG